MKSVRDSLRKRSAKALQIVRNRRLTAVSACMIAAAWPSLVLGHAAEGGADADTLRSLRLSFNQAIAARDPAAVARFMTTGSALLASNGEVLQGGGEISKSYQTQEFVDPAFIAYDRQPDSFDIAPGGRLAVERGHWRGRFRSPQGGEEGSAGLYQAGWIRIDGQWRIQTEAYVRLTCRRSADC